MDDPDFDVVDDWYYETFTPPAGVTEVTLPAITVWSHDVCDVCGFSSYYAVEADEWVVEALKVDP